MCAIICLYINATLTCFYFSILLEEKRQKAPTIFWCNNCLSGSCPSKDIAVWQLNTLSWKKGHSIVSMSTYFKLRYSEAGFRSRLEHFIFLWPAFLTIRWCSCAFSSMDVQVGVPVFRGLHSAFTCCTKNAAKPANSSAKAIEQANTRFLLAPCTPGITVLVELNRETR